MYKHIKPAMAQDLLLKLAVKRDTEIISVYAGLNRIIAEDIYAAFPMPPFQKSPFDGYALRSADTPGTLRVVRTIAAGDSAAMTLLPGEAVRIFTGSPVPNDADTVVKQENVLCDGVILSIGQKLSSNTNIIQTGEDYPRGALLIPAGTVLEFAHLGVLASQGLGTISVYKKPIVSVISTGSELTEPGMERTPYHIYNSSAAAICAWLSQHGMEPRYAGIVPDQAAHIQATVSACMDCSDVVITTGGASVGDYDFAVDTAAAIGAESLFWKIDMKPGGAILASTKNGKLLLSLSGNPAAAMMGLIVIAQPYLRKLCGMRSVDLQTVRLPLKNPLPKISTTTRMLRGRLYCADGKAFFNENAGRGNGNLSSFEGCNLIGIVPPGNNMLDAGTYIDAIFV